MLVLAKSIIGKEYLYDPKSAHSVSNNSAERIRKVLNDYKFKINNGETWFLHEVFSLDSAYAYAHYQKFTIRKGLVKEVSTYSYFNV